MKIDDIQQLNCKEIIARELGQPLKDRGKRWAWACPLHGGQKPNFTADETGWHCWSDCNEGGDLISFIQKYHGMTFLEACRYLGADEPEFERKPAPTRPHWHTEQPPAHTWQQTIEGIVSQAIDCLWSDKGKVAREYLHGRGLTNQTIDQARLGYIPETKKWYNLPNGVKVPSGITIPSTLRGELWQVRVRRVIGATPDDKYRSIGDGRLVGSLFWGDKLKPFQPVIVVESEMDCLTLLQLMGKFSPVALSSASNTLTKHWLTKLIFTPAILLRTDADEAGKRCLDRHLALSDSIKAITIPEPYKDVNELYQANPAACQAWLDGVLAPYQYAKIALTPTPQAPKYRTKMRHFDLVAEQSYLVIGIANHAPRGWKEEYQLSEQAYFEWVKQGLPTQEMSVIHG